MRIPKFASFLVVLLAAVVGAQAQTVRKTIPYPSGVSGVAVDSNKGRAYILLPNFTDSGANAVQVFDSEEGSRPLATFSVPVANAIAVNGSTGTVYVTGSVPDGTDANGNTISLLEVVAINPKTGAIIATIPVSTTPGSGIVALAVDTRTNSVFAADQSDNAIAVINGKTNTLTSFVGLNGAPTGLAVNSGSGKVVATVATTDVDGNPLAEAATLTEKTGAVTYATYGLFAGGVAFDSGLKRVYPVDANFPGAVVAMSNGSILDNIVVGNSPLGITIDGGNGDIFVANSADGTVSKISAATNAVINTVDAGPVGQGDAQYIAIDTDEKRVWVAGFVSVTIMTEN
jgi:DNA-binding beta-propeller fold protein YncE